jgi:hypothetical protein
MDRVPHAKTREVVDDLGFTQQRSIGIAIADVTRNQRHPIGRQAGKVFPLAVHQVVDHHDARAAIGELTHQLGSDETGATGDHD